MTQTDTKKINIANLLEFVDVTEKTHTELEPYVSRKIENYDGVSTKTIVPIITETLNQNKTYDLLIKTLNTNGINNRLDTLETKDLPYDSEFKIPESVKKTIVSDIADIFDYFNNKTSNYTTKNRIIEIDTKIPDLNEQNPYKQSLTKHITSLNEMYTDLINESNLYKHKILLKNIVIQFKKISRSINFIKEQKMNVSEWDLEEILNYSKNKEKIFYNIDKHKQKARIYIKDEPKIEKEKTDFLTKVYNCINGQ